LSIFIRLIGETPADSAAQSFYQNETVEVTCQISYMENPQLSEREESSVKKQITAVCNEHGSWHGFLLN
jgi:hypothetical protein